MADSDSSSRQVGLLGATGVGVGAIVGGGILVLAGVAYAQTGPAALVAFALNGAIALLTAMSFAEISSAFPESGGAYAFAKKVLSVRAAFAVGWILWFAYIVAGVLYALGFASFASLALAALWEIGGASPPAWLDGRRMTLLLASGATIVYAASLVRKTTGGGAWVTVGKVVVFAVIIAAGTVALAVQPLRDTGAALTPFFSAGAPSLLAAMGFTFIALQGFDLIAAIAGEVKDPGRIIPRSMFLSLGCALLIYLPLLFLVATVGVERGESIQELAAAQPETVTALAVSRFMGPLGYWLVVVAAILSTLSALHANILAASRVALSMGRDRTLPKILADVHADRRTPIMAIYATALTLIAILLMVPNLAAAGAAASLIFLISFALAHVTAFLARARGGRKSDAYFTPWFPAIPVLGGLACAALAAFQALAVPDAGAIVFVWLALGVLLYLSVFARRAEAADASAEAFDPDLARLRGHSPLVLLPIANPAHARAMVEVANALAPNQVGRVLLLTVVHKPHEGEIESKLAMAQRVVSEALTVSYAGGHRPEALITAAPVAGDEIVRIAAEHRCESVLLGIGVLAQVHDELQLEALIRNLSCDAAIMRAPAQWRLNDAKRILVPVGGRGEQDELRARLLGSICRTAPREIRFVTVLPAQARDAEAGEALRNLSNLADVRVPGTPIVEVIRSDDAAAAILEQAESADLLVTGLRSVGRRQRLFGDVTLRIAREVPCAAIMLSRGHRSFVSRTPAEAGAQIYDLFFSRKR